MSGTGCHRLIRCLLTVLVVEECVVSFVSGAEIVEGGGLLCRALPQTRVIDRHVITPYHAFYIQTNIGSKQLVQICVLDEKRKANIFIDCGAYSFNGLIGNTSDGFALQIARDWGGCQLAIANVTPQPAGIAIQVSIVGQAPLELEQCVRIPVEPASPGP